MSDETSHDLRTNYHLYWWIHQVVIAAKTSHAAEEDWIAIAGRTSHVAVSESVSVFEVGK